MPIGKDDGERTAATAATTVDRDIIAAAAGVRGGGALGTRPNPTHDIVAQAANGDRPNFNPVADIRAGRVQQAPPIIGPVAQPSSQAIGREPGDFDRIFQVAAPKRPEPEPKESPRLEQAPEPKRPMKAELPAAAKKDYPSGRPAAEPKGRSTAGVSGPSRVMDEIAMKAGALTTVPAVEGYEYDEPTEADAYADALDLARAEAREQGKTGTAIDVYAGMRAPELMADTQATEDGDVASRMFKAGMRATRRGVNAGGSNERQRAMTAAEFARLSPRQKAAVELTSLLAAASERDRAIPRANRDVTDDYRESVEALFTGEGVEASRKNYAPNTVSVLEDIGWKGTATDLDDVLSGKLGFTRQDLVDLERPENKSGTDVRLNTAAKMRDDLQSSLVRAFTASRKEAVTGENLLGAKRELLDYDEMPGFSTGKSREVAPGVDLNTYVRKAFDILADSNSQYEPQQVLDQAKVTLTEEEFQSFLNFVDLNSRESKNYRQPLGNTEGQTYFDPVEFRQSIAKELREERGRARSR